MRKHSWLVALPLWYFVLYAPSKMNVIRHPGGRENTPTATQYGPYQSQESCEQWSLSITSLANNGQLLNGPTARSTCWSDDPADDSPPPSLQDFQNDPVD